MSIAEVRQAIADAIETTGVSSTAYVTDQVNTPQAMVVAGDITYARTFDPTHTYDYSITVYVTREARYGQEFLDSLKEPEGETSIKAAVENDIALKELIQYVTVVRASRAEQAVVGETQYLAVVFDVEVIV